MSSLNTENLTYGEVVHASKHRIRIISTLLHNDTERASVLAVLLQMREGIRKVRTIPAIATVVIYFDPDILPKTALLTILDALLGNLGRKNTPVIPHKSKQLKQSSEEHKITIEQTFNITFEGLKCASCALLIEIILKRDPRITSAYVNYTTQTATVQGTLSKECLSVLIDQTGYKIQTITTVIS